MSFPRVRSLRNSAHFARVRREGQARVGRHLLVTAVAAPQPGSMTLFGLVTPRYVGKAHERNLLRRRLRAIIAARLDEIADGRHVVTLARRGAGGADFATLEREWAKLARRAGLLEGGDANSKGTG